MVLGLELSFFCSIGEWEIIQLLPEEGKENIVCKIILMRINENNPKQGYWCRTRA